MGRLQEMNDYEDYNAYCLASRFQSTRGRRSYSRPFSIGERCYAAQIGT